MAHGVARSDRSCDRQRRGPSDLAAPEDQRLLYSLLIESNLSVAARKAIEMQPGLEKFFSEAQRRNFERGRAEGKAEGKPKERRPRCCRS